MVAKAGAAFHFLGKNKKRRQPFIAEAG